MTQRDNNHTYQVYYYIKLFTIFTMESPIVVNVPCLLSEYRLGTLTGAKSDGDVIVRCEKSNHKQKTTFTVIQHNE